MLNVVLSNRFKKDLKNAAKRGYDLDLLDAVVNTLASQQPLLKRTGTMRSLVIILDFASAIFYPISCSSIVYITKIFYFSFPEPEHTRIYFDFEKDRASPIPTLRAGITLAILARSISARFRQRDTRHPVLWFPVFFITPHQIENKLNRLFFNFIPRKDHFRRIFKQLNPHTPLIFFFICVQ